MMNRLLLLILMLAPVSPMLIAQKPVQLRIHHKLGEQPFMLNQSAMNNMGSTFKVTRLQYYLSNFRIYHDGGQLERVTDVYALANAQETTIIDLGSYPISNIEKIQFSVGVNQPVNNADPSLWPASHPLAPQSPSMHWGWAAGYRFAVIEGFAGAALNTTFQFHALGNDNYFNTIVDVQASLVNDSLIIDLNADYTRAVENIDLDQGPIVHGDNGLNVDILQNFSNLVFTSSGSSTSTVDGQPQEALRIYPNPTSGICTLQPGDPHNGLTNIDVVNTAGQVIMSLRPRIDETMVIHIPEPGLYFLKYSGPGHMSGVKKIIVR